VKCKKVQQVKLVQTYIGGYPLKVTHVTNNLPVSCLKRAERTGSIVVSYSTVIGALNSLFLALHFL
jgi:hypothetical protein